MKKVENNGIEIFLATAGKKLLGIMSLYNETPKVDFPQTSKELENKNMSTQEDFMAVAKKRKRRNTWTRPLEKNKEAIIKNIVCKSYVEDDHSYCKSLKLDLST